MTVSSGLEAVRERIGSACAACGRDPAEVTLVAVSKTAGVDAIREAYDCGQRAFGENRLQEAIPKIEALPADVEWHFIGKLQSNKARRVAELFSVIHTLESTSQLEQLQKATKVVDGLIEVNIGDEPQKSGVPVKLLAEFAKNVLQCTQVRFRGLMTIGPANLNAEDTRPFFRTMRGLRERIGCDWLSMGMSGDLEVAIQEGATHVRIGTAIFGERH